MTDRRQAPVENGDPDREEPRLTIPDGGLGAAMPEWLQQTPSWKRMEPLPARAIPPADTSVIDPRRLIDVDDLPEWLQAVAARSESVQPAGPTLADPQAVEAAPRLPTVDDGAVPPVTYPSVVEPKMRAHDPAHVQWTPSPSAATRPWWLSDAAVAALFVAIILTMIYVVLAASDIV